MNNTSLVDNIKSKGLFYGCVLFATFPLFGMKVQVFLLITLAVLALAQAGLNQFKNSKIANRENIGFIGLFTCLLLGLLYTENMVEGWSIIERSTSIVLFPILFSLSYKNITAKQLDWILKTFVASVFLLSLYIIVAYNFIDIDAAKNNNLTLRKSIGAIVGKQHAYVNILVFTASSILLFFTNRYYILKNKKGLLTSLLLIVFFLVFGFFVGTRMPILAFLIVAFLSIFKFVQISLVKKSILALSLLIVFSISIFKVPVLKKRFGMLTQNISSVNATNKNKTPRLKINSCSLPLCKANPILGMGTGDVVDELVECYKSNNHWGALSLYKYNAHNQYISYHLRAGALGLVFFLFILFCLGNTRNQGQLPILLAVYFSLCFLTENIMERQLGILLFCFLSALIMVGVKNEISPQ